MTRIPIRHDRPIGKVKQFVFTVQYLATGNRHRVQCSVPFEKWRLDPAFKMRLKAKLVGEQREVEVPCIDL